MSDSQQGPKPMTIAQSVPVELMQGGRLSLGQVVDLLTAKMTESGIVDMLNVTMSTRYDGPPNCVVVEMTAPVRPAPTLVLREGGPAENGPAPRGLMLRDSK